MRHAPALVAVAHGSRDSRSAATISALVDRVRWLRPDLDVRLAFLDLCVPRLDAVLATVPSAVVVPLLLGRAFHAKVDVPGAVARALAVRPGLDVTVADVLGPDPRLEAVTLRRLAEVDVSPDDPGTGVVLAAAGSQQAQSNAAVAAVAAAWTQRTRWQVVPAFACAARPTVPDAIATLQAAGAQRIAVASWFLAPGLLPDKVNRQARESRSDAVLAAPLGAHDAVATLTVDRYERARVTASHTETVVPCCKHPHRGPRSGRTTWADTRRAKTTRRGSRGTGVCGPRWAPVRCLPAPFACPRCGAKEMTLARTADRIAAGAALREAVADFVDDLRWARDEDNVAQRITERPHDLDPRTDAYLAALAEHFATAHEVPVPRWASEPGRFLSRIWWPRYPGLWARAIVESPAAFRRRGILLGAGMLSRV